uniref:O-fucosyltransferase family protein n=1 Tax=Opuntia streptacantha TaxID=393608 RepID=A0A7C8ZZZ6_OPUST
MSLINGLPKQFSDSDHTPNSPRNQDPTRNHKPNLTPRFRKRIARVRPWKRFKGLVCLIGLVGLFFVVNWWMLYRISHTGFGPKIRSSNNNPISSVVIKKDLREIIEVKRPQKTRFGRLLKLAAHALAEGQMKPEPKGLWEEPYALASNWKPCAEERDWEPSEGNNGYIMITANGGLNQQRVAVCNAVAIARLLNATLVVPKFMFSSVWRDESLGVTVCWEMLRLTCAMMALTYYFC